MFWIPKYLNEERNVSFDEIGRLLWIPFLALGLSNMIGGYFSDTLLKYGCSINKARKVVMGTAAFFTLSAMFVQGVSGIGWAIGLMSLLMFAHGFWITNYITSISDVFGSTATSTVVGLTGTAGAVAGIIVNPLIGFVVQNYSYEPLWIICGIMYPIAFLILADPLASDGDQSSAVAQCGIARTRDLVKWDRLADLKTPSPQQRNVVLHPEFVDGKYAFYTRPQDSFINAGKGGGIGFGLSDSVENAVIDEEIVIDQKLYHTVYEAKNGLGPAPIKTSQGWLHLAHGVRHTAAGLRYVLYLFMTSLSDLTKVIYKPAGYFIAPEGDERIGDVSNVLFSNGWIADEDGTVHIYYASSDTRQHVATSSIERLLDYVTNTPSDGLSTSTSVATVYKIVDDKQKE